MSSEINRFELAPLELPGNAKEITSSSLDKKENGIFSREVFSNEDSIGFIKIPPCPKFGTSFQFENAHRDLKNDLVKLLTYEAYLIKINGEWELREKAPKKQQDIIYGVDAARKLYPDIDVWADYWMTDFIIVPHPKFRPLITQNNNTVLVDMNNALVEILKRLESLKEYEFIKDYNIIRYYRKIYGFYKDFTTEIYRLLSNGTNCFIRKELKSNKFPGMIRSTLINRCDLDEDEILIGDDFIKTLYPWLYEKHNGNMEMIQTDLDNREACVILNRAPSISWGSLLALKPKIASVYDNNKKSLGVIGINPIICPALAGDFDGDCLMVFSLYSQKANQEAKQMLPSKNWYDLINGRIRNKYPAEVEFVK